MIKSRFQTRIEIWCLFVILHLALGIYPLFAQDKIVAIVNSDIITQNDLNDFINFMRIQLSVDLKGERLESKIQSMKVDLMDRLIEDRLILQEAKRTGIKIDENRIKAKLGEIKKHYPSDIEFQNALRKQGLVQADLETRTREQLLMYEIIEMKVKSKITVSPNEVTDFYRKNPEEFKLPQQRRFETIAIEDQNLIVVVCNDLKNGRGFEDLSKKYSLTLNKLEAMRDGRLKKEIEEAVFKLNPGEVSEPVKIDGKYYIFKLNDVIMSRQQSLAEVQEKIYAFLFDNKMREGLTGWLDELKKNAYIKIPEN